LDTEQYKESIEKKKKAQALFQLYHFLFDWIRSEIIGRKRRTIETKEI